MATRRNFYQPSTYLSFDGAANSYVALGVTNVLPNATAACSMAVWVYMGPFGTGSTDSIRVIIGNRRDSTTAGWVLKIANKAKNKLEFAFYDQNNSSQGWISNYTVPFFRWTHVGITFDGRQVIFYVDGNAEPKETVGTPKTITEYTGQNLRIGHRQAAGSTFETYSGKMADLCIWNRKLTTEEFADLYNLRAVPTNGLLARWIMNEGSGTTITDTVGSVTGTLTGGVSWSTTVLNTERSVAGTRALAGARTLAGERTAV